jgi:hypothetical protein
MSVSAGFDRFERSVPVAEPAAARCAGSVSGRTVERPDDEVHRRLAAALERWEAGQDAPALRKALLDLLGRLN